MRSPASETALEYLHRTGVFYVTLLPDYSQKWNFDAPIETHETVLRPLLGMSLGAWVYGISPNSPAWSSAGEILQRDKGKHRIRTEGDPICGHEYFWNVSSGKRGSVVIAVAADDVRFPELFPHCYSPRVMTNHTATQTPSAVRFARSLVEKENRIACLLSRNNGFDWLHIMARPELAESLFQSAELNCMTEPDDVA